MKIFVKDSKNDTLVFDDLSDSDKVKKLKDQIIIKGEIKNNNINLIFGSCLLEDEEELCYYGIGNMNTITYVGEFHAGRYE